MMKKLLAVLVVSGSLYGYEIDDHDSNIIKDYEVLQKRALQTRYDRLSKYNRWYIKDLYHLIKPNIKHVYSVLKDMPDALLHSVIGHHTHTRLEARVRFAEQDALGEQEKIFLNQRQRNTKEGLQKFLGIDIPADKQPRVAMCFSGGGFRAMILTLGALIAAQDTGLLDCTTYMAGLSGSTWAMAPWLATKQNLHRMRDTLHKKIHRGIRHLTRHKDRKQVLKHLLTKAWYRQGVSAMDIYGPLLANTLLTDLGDKKLTAGISDTHDHIMQGRYPMPIYTSIASNKEPYEWFEFTPFEVGSAAIGAYVPTWAYGRKFKHGVSTNYAPEQSLGYCMGIFGSAFEVDIEDLARIGAHAIKEVKDDLPAVTHGAIDTIIDKLVNSPLDDVRLAPSMLPCFVHQVPDNPFADCKRLSLVDAGIDFNLPFVPLLRAARNVDVIIVYDSSAGRVGEDLKLAAAYAQRKGIPFPPVPDDVGEHLCSVLRDENNPACPVIIYMPRIKNEGYSTTFDPTVCSENSYCGTFNFTYSEANVKELSGLSEYTCKQYMDTIRIVILERMKAMQ